MSVCVCVGVCVCVCVFGPWVTQLWNVAGWWNLLAHTDSQSHIAASLCGTRLRSGGEGIYHVCVLSRWQRDAEKNARTAALHFTNMLTAMNKETPRSFSQLISTREHCSYPILEFKWLNAQIALKKHLNATPHSSELNIRQLERGCMYIYSQRPGASVIDWQSVRGGPLPFTQRDLG